MDQEAAGDAAPRKTHVRRLRQHQHAQIGPRFKYRQRLLTEGWGQYDFVEALSNASRKRFANLNVRCHNAAKSCKRVPRKRQSVGCGRVASAAQAIQLPCVGVLGQLRQDLVAIQQAHAGTQRILAFLDAQRQTRLASNVPASKGLQQFRSSGSLDQYQRIRSFVSYPAAPFAQRVGGDVAAQLGSLRSDLGHVEFYSGARWAATTQAHTDIRQAYVADYRQSHARREQLLRDLITKCQQHRNWNQLDANAQQAILDALSQHACAAALGMLDESAGFVCTTCRSDAGALSSQITGIPALEAQKLAQFDSLDQPPQAQPQPGLETVVFAKQKSVAAGEVGAFAESFSEALSSAVAKGAVTVDIQIHTQTREGE